MTSTRPTTAAAARSPGEDYVTLTLGRDFGDVSPLRGVIQGGGAHLLQVDDGSAARGVPGPGPRAPRLKPPHHSREPQHAKEDVGDKDHHQISRQKRHGHGQKAPDKRGESTDFAIIS